MLSAAELIPSQMRHPMNFGSADFSEHKYAYYTWMRENAPVYRGKILLLNAYALSRYEDCIEMLKDPRFVRNRTTATGGGRIPFPMPKSVQMLASSMITEDDPAHRRLRCLVKDSFKPRAVAKYEPRIEHLTHELLDRVPREGQIDLVESYAFPLPVRVISDLVGVPDEDVHEFARIMDTVTKGMTGWRLFKTFAWELPATVKVVHRIIEKKRRNPGEDLLSELIAAESEGDRLLDDEIAAMVMLLVIAGYETTAHLITNAVRVLLEHPAQLERLRQEPALMKSAVEEVLRFMGPVQATKPGWAREDLRLHGVKIPRGSAVLPLLGAANRDPKVFDKADEFDITRSPNLHLGFGFGPHYCLGANLAKMEARISLSSLLERNPNLRLAVDPKELTIQAMPFWHRHERLPVILG